MTRRNSGGVPQGIFGRGMREIKTDCEAPMHEGQIYGSAGSRLVEDVHVRPMFLTRLWETCMMRLDDQLRDEDEELLPCKDCRLFWSFKGSLAETNDEELERTLEINVNVPCLEDIVKRFNDSILDAKVKGTLYTWGLRTDVTRDEEKIRLGLQSPFKILVVVLLQLIIEAFENSEEETTLE